MFLAFRLFITTVLPPWSKTIALLPPRKRSALHARNTIRRFPNIAIAYCLEEARKSIWMNLIYVVFYDKPFLKFERLLETYIAYSTARVPLIQNGDTRSG